MHEFSLCQYIVEAVEAKACEKNFQCVSVIWLEIGELAGVDYRSLVFSFPIAASDSVAKNAVLKIISIEGKGFCALCQKEIGVKNYFDACPGCGLHDYQITQGKELRIVKMETN